jgi:predicted ribosome quality control (RQC) complex YloA/Tae2 family protein
MAIEQIGFERVIKISLETKNGKGALFIELYSSGNIIYVDNEDIILAVYHQKIWNEQRKILHKQKYTPSISLPVLYSLSFQDFFSILSTSTKDQLVTALAIDFGLGGQYAQESLFQADISPSIFPSSLSSADANKLYATITSLFTVYQPGIFQKDLAFPFPLKSLIKEASLEDESLETLWEPKDSFNEAIASLTFSILSSFQKKSSNKEKKSSLSKSQIVLAKQEKQLKGLEISQKENQEKGELIYLYYQEIQKLLSEINKLKKMMSWSDVKKELSSLSYLKEINEHQGTITIDIKTEDKP